MWRADRLGLGRAALAQVDREDRHRADGEELGLPVLQRAVPEVARGHVAQPAHRGELVIELLGVVGDVAVDRLHAPRGEPDRGHEDHQRVGVDAGAPAADAGPARRVRVRVLADHLLLVGLAARLAQLLRLRGAALEEPDGGEDVERELEELGLPVLHHVAAEARREDVAAERDRVVVVAQLVVVEVGVADERLADQRGQEDAAEEQPEAVVADEAPHQRPRKPMIRNRTRSARIRSTYQRKSTGQASSSQSKGVFVGVVLARQPSAEIRQPDFCSLRKKLSPPARSTFAFVIATLTPSTGPPETLTDAIACGQGLLSWLSSALRVSDASTPQATAPCLASIAARKRSVVERTAARSSDWPQPASARSPSIAGSARRMATTFAPARASPPALTRRCAGSARSACGRPRRTRAARGCASARPRRRARSCPGGGSIRARPG